MLNEGIDMTKNELRKFIKDVFDDEIKDDKNKTFTEKDIKKIVRDIFRNHYKTLWQKSNLFLTGLN